MIGRYSNNVYGNRNRNNAYNYSAAEVEGKNGLLRKIQTYGFALYDTILYLNSHPTDSAALEYYSQTKDAYQSARDEYISEYAPLSAYEVDVQNGWSWIDGKEPWQYDAN